MLFKVTALSRNEQQKRLQGSSLELDSFTSLHLLTGSQSNSATRQGRKVRDGTRIDSVYNLNCKLGDLSSRGELPIFMGRHCLQNNILDFGIDFCQFDFLKQLIAGLCEYQHRHKGCNRRRGGGLQDNFLQATDKAHFSDGGEDEIIAREGRMRGIGTFDSICWSERKHPSLLKNKT